MQIHAWCSRCGRPLVWYDQPDDGIVQLRHLIFCPKCYGSAGQLYQGSGVFDSYFHHVEQVNSLIQQKGKQ